MDLINAPDIKKTGRKQPVVTITFQDPDKEFNNARKQHIKGETSSSENIRGPAQSQLKRPGHTSEPDLDSDDLDLKKTRYEIMKFAVKSLKDEERVDAEERLVIQLGGQEGEEESCQL